MPIILTQCSMELYYISNTQCERVKWFQCIASLHKSMRAKMFTKLIYLQIPVILDSIYKTFIRCQRKKVVGES